jgi:hypothetical protein
MTGSPLTEHNLKEIQRVAISKGNPEASSSNANIT